MVKGKSTGAGTPGVVCRSDVVDFQEQFAIGHSDKDGQPRHALRYDFHL